MVNRKETNTKEESDMTTQNMGILAILVFGVLALIAVILWVLIMVANMDRHRRKMLFGPNLNSLFQLGCSATVAVFTASVVLLGLYLNPSHSNAGIFTSLVVGVGLLVVLCVVLWPLTGYLYYQPERQAKQLTYVYWLPRDADEVRYASCKQGILMAVRLYPRIVIDTGLLDTLERSSQVSTRHELFPKRGGLQMTNDFGVYCDLCSEGFLQGYTVFLAECQADPDHLEGARTLLKQWPETKEAEQLMDEFVSKILPKEKEEK